MTDPKPPKRKQPRLRRRISRRIKNTGILPATLWVLILLLLLAAAIWIGFTRLLRDAAPWELGGLETNTPGFQVMQLVLTLIGGIGAAILVVVAYRRQRDLETARFDDRFAAAAAQLGADTAAERLAGVYAMAALADTWQQHRQQCINVLCAYLRLPYDPSAGLLAEVVSEHTWPVGAGTGKETRTYRTLPNDREVRHTIIRVLTEHLRDTATTSWQGHDFDFTGAVFDGGDFRGAHFNSGKVSFADAVFAAGKVSFVGATFAGGGEVSFVGATFADGGEVSFDSAAFAGGQVSFAEAEFVGGSVSFDLASFAGGGEVSFAEASFTGGRVSFIGARFTGASSVWFAEATFTGAVVPFNGARFTGGGKVSFDDAWFAGGLVTFTRARFTGGGGLSFDDARFIANGQVSFANAEFAGGVVSFDGTHFANNAKVYIPPSILSVGWPTRNGQLFNGWPPLSGPEDAAGDELPPAEPAET